MEFNEILMLKVKYKKTFSMRKFLIKLKEHEWNSLLNN